MRTGTHTRTFMLTEMAKPCRYNDSHFCKHAHTYSRGAENTTGVTQAAWWSTHETPETSCETCVGHACARAQQTVTCRLSEKTSK
jgi:hypothetical protein